jgi:hypothetical protein
MITAILWLVTLLFGSTSKPTAQPQTSDCIVQTGCDTGR